jgi:hypothetical protein
MVASLRGREPREQRNIHCWKLLPRRAVQTVTENTSLCVIVICVENQVNAIISPNPVHSQSRDSSNINIKLKEVAIRRWSSRRNNRGI